jgi:hypothetical protein
MLLPIENSQKNIAEPRQGNSTIRFASFTTSQIDQVESTPAPGNSMALTGNTVLVHVESVEQVGVSSAACATITATATPAADCCVQVEGCLLCCWHPEFALVL